MATQEGLRFLLTADVKEFERALKDAATLSKQTADGITKAGIKIAGTGNYVADLTRDIRSLVSSMKDGSARFVAFGSSVDKTGTITRNFTKSTGNASTALTGLTRIAQDAPFGFIAIGNNLAETVTQMGALIKTSGGTGAALKALGSSLIGPGGVVLGLNLLITGITVAVQKYGSFGAAINAILNPLSEQAKLQKEINDTIVQGAKDAQKEIVSLDNLYRAATNINIPLSERKKIVDELQSRYPAYFKNLKDENILTGNAANAYNQLRDAILAKATAQAMEGKVQELQSKKIDLLSEENSLREKRLDIILAENKAEEQLDKLLNKGVRSTGAIKQQDALTAKIVRLKGEQSDYTKEIDRNKAAQDSLNETINKFLALGDQLAVKFGAGVFIDPTKAQKEVKLIYDAIKGLEEINKLLDTGRRQDIFIKPEVTKFQAPDIFDPKSVADSAARYAQALAAAIKFEWNKTVIPAVEISAMELNKILNTSLVDGIVGISAGIGSALAGGGLSGVISGFVNMIAGFMEKLGTALVVQGLSIEAFNKSLITLQGYGAIAAGGALIAAAAAFRSIAGKGVDSYATGGTVYGPQVIAAGDNTTQKEHILSDMQLKKIADGAGIGGGGDIIAETHISGNQLAILLRRAGFQISRING